MTATAPTIPIRLFGAADAARYLGISPTNLRAQGIPRRVLGGRFLYDIKDLDAFATDLPYEFDTEETNRCDTMLDG